MVSLLYTVTVAVHFMQTPSTHRTSYRARYWLLL